MTALRIFVLVKLCSIIYSRDALQW